MAGINDKTVVPIAWLFISIGATAAGAFSAAICVSSINYRLARIEHQIGIEPYASFGVISPAEAAAPLVSTIHSAKIKK